MRLAAPFGQPIQSRINGSRYPRGPFDCTGGTYPGRRVTRTPNQSTDHLFTGQTSWRSERTGTDAAPGLGHNGAAPLVVIEQMHEHLDILEIGVGRQKTEPLADT